jgi:phytoene dehydrogenase-like protein
MNKFDAIIIGSGHNGLITGCYLAKAGYKVGVIEKRDTIGGAVCTETMFKSPENPHGFRMDVGSSVHIMIHQTGIIEELGLTDYGLEYIEMDPFMSYPIPDGKGVIHFFKDLDRTLDSISEVAPEDVGNYKEFVDFWSRINRQKYRYGNAERADEGWRNVQKRGADGWASKNSRQLWKSGG